MMNTPSVVAAAAALITASSGLSTSPAEAEEQNWKHTDLRVAVYNIQAGLNMDGEFDLDSTAEAIADMDADVVALNEVDAHWDERSEWRDLGEELAESLDMNLSFGPIYTLDPEDPDDPPREYGNAILSKYDIVYEKNHEITRLASVEEDPEPEMYPGFPEIVINVKGNFTHLYSTHLEVADVDVREQQFDDMIEILERPKIGSQVLLGDLNKEPGSAEGEKFWKDMDDAWVEANGDKDGFTFPADAPERRIDYVAVTPEIEVEAAETIDTLASDHLPTVVDLKIPRFHWWS